MSKDDLENLIPESPVRVVEKESIGSKVCTLKMLYLTPEQLAGFSKYKYASIDTSPLSKYVMHPFWNWGVKFFPMWFPPNVMTFLGYALLVVDYVLLAYYDWDFSASSHRESLIPRWVWFVIAFNHFWSHQLDGMDGKQARRTGSGSPLGELMDHGIDSNCMWMLPVTMMSVLGAGSDGISLQQAPAMLITMTFNFWIAHWEKYNTGVLYLPWFFDIAQLTVALVFFLTGVYTPYGLKSLFATHLAPLPSLLIVAIPGGAAVALVLSCLNVRSAIKKGTSKENTRSWGSMMKPWVSYLLMNILLLVYPYYCQEEFIADPRVWTLAYGFTFSSLVCRLMINQMTSTECALIEQPIRLLFLAMIVTVLAKSLSGVVMQIYSVGAMMLFFHYAYNVINEVCDHLNICAFSILRKRR